MKLANDDRRPWAIFLIFLRLGLTSFGGPIAHLGFFRDEFVTRRQWLSDRSYADWVALCQFLPGPASSQTGMALGFSQAGYAGALAAWAGFTLPSAVMMILFASSLADFGEILTPGMFRGFKWVAVAVVAQAVWGMASYLCRDKWRVTLMTLAAFSVLLMPTAATQVGVIVAAGVAGRLWLKPVQVAAHDLLPIALSRRAGAVWLSLFVVLLVGLPFLKPLFEHRALAMVDAFYRSGALVFGGGHVVLPLLQAEVVQTGWVSSEVFLAGYGVAQAVPGPLFTFAGFLGAAMGGWLGGVLGLLAIFTPSFLLVAGALSFWERLRGNAAMQAALSGINAAVTGLLLAALYQPVWTSAIHQPQDFGAALVAFVALVFWKLPPWLVVAASGAVGWLIA
ncbi:MAG: chromate efflux transporter [Methylomicrobium sp.]